MTTDLHDLVGAYALSALDPDEQSAFESHLTTCATCRDEVAGFHLTAARLAEGVAETPPPELRDRLLASITQVPQERPVVTHLRPRGALRRTLPSLVAAAAIAVAAVGVTGYVVENRNNSELVAQQDAVQELMTAADASIIAEDLADGGQVRVVHSPTLGAAMVSVSSLPKLSNHDYQLWTLSSGEATSAGILDASDMVYLGDIAESDRMAVTVEPEGGSDRPTTVPIAAMDL